VFQGNTVNQIADYIADYPELYPELFDISEEYAEDGHADGHADVYSDEHSPDGANTILIDAKGRKTEELRLDGSAGGRRVYGESNLMVYGFDSFEGLPEDWAIGVMNGKEDTDRFIRGKTFDLRGNLPVVRPNVRLLKGWFDKTLPEFLDGTAKFVNEQSRVNDAAAYEKRRRAKNSNAKRRQRREKAKREKLKGEKLKQESRRRKLENNSNRSEKNEKINEFEAHNNPLDVISMRESDDAISAGDGVLADRDGVLAGDAVLAVHSAPSQNGWLSRITGGIFGSFGSPEGSAEGSFMRSSSPEETIAEHSNLHSSLQTNTNQHIQHGQNLNANSRLSADSGNTNSNPVPNLPPHLPIALLHIDCDLYSSTKTIFELLSDRIVPGTVIVFDELVNYPAFKKHEVLAFYEFLAGIIGNGSQKLNSNAGIIGNSNGEPSSSGKSKKREFEWIASPCGVDLVIGYPVGAMEGDGSCLAVAVRILA
jgi:hypothetical protein